MRTLRLLVLDAEAAADGLAAGLSEGTYHVVATLADSREALDVARAERPDAVLVDAELPGEVTGTEVARRIRAELDIPVVYMSVGTDDAVLERGLAALTDGYLLKPVTAGSLRVAVELAVRRHAVEWELKANEPRDGAFHDVLTGLPNRAVFLDRVFHAIALLSRRPAALFSVLYLDLDRFKVINDSLGHGIGDHYLKAVAARIRDSLRRPADSVARISGDEFAILLEELNDASDPTRVAARVQQSLAVPVRVGSHSLHSSVSVGIALSTGGYQRAEDILRDAETAMHRAKASGGSVAVTFDPAMHAHAVERLTLESDLRHAVEHREFFVNYQPVVSLGSGQIAGFEALARWMHPSRGMVPPKAFIPVAEETGLIVAIGSQMLEQACRQLGQWRASGTLEPRQYVSVNLSARQFQHGDLVDSVDALLRAHDLPPSCLKLEITESLLLEESDAIHSQLSGLKALGVQLLLDDFGTGYSSLAYLQRFPIDIVKVDRAFVSNMEETKRAQLVEIIILLARTLKMDVVAEGVETAIQLARLKELRCDFAQGYFFSRPVPADEAVAFLKR